MKYFLSFFLFLVSTLIGTSQEAQAPLLDDVHVALTTKHYGDKIVLRWAPTSEEWWIYGMLNGYQIARKDMSDVRNKYEVLVDTLRPWSKSKIEQWFSTHPEDEELAVPMKTMYMEWENTRYVSGGLEDLINRSEYFKQRFHMTILGSDIYPLVSEASGLRYEDKTIQEGKLYSYRVRLNKSDAGQGAYHVCKSWNVVDRPIVHEAIEKEGRIVIKWDRALHDNVYTSYYIEKSRDTINFQRINTHPYIQGIGEGLTDGKYISFIDEVENYELFYYRIIGIDAFGDYSLPSAPVFAQGRDRTPPKVQTPQVLRSEGANANLIKWSHQPMEEISQVIIYKKDSKADDHIVYNKTKKEGISFEVEDTDVIEGLSMYHVVLVDTAGNIGQSLSGEMYIQDKTPPNPPVNLKAKVDTSGRVVLTWDQGPDLDVIAYYIFTAPNVNDNFIKLNQKKHLFRIYEDSINMTLLTDKRYYKVAAMDKGGNIGDYSEILEVNLPDKIPPAPCLFYDYRVDSAGVFLGLMPSSSKDVVAHKLFRRQVGSAEWKLIRDFGKNPPQVFQDNTMQSGGSYTYKWIAEDEGGLQSSDEHSQLNITAFDTRSFYRPQLRLSKTKEGVQIEVTNNIPGTDYRIQIVRSYKGSKYRTLTTINDGFQYLDELDYEGNEKIGASYRAKVLYKDGTRSKFGKEISI